MPTRPQRSKVETEKAMSLAIEDVEARGLSYRDAAEQIGVPAKTLWGRVHGRKERRKAPEAEQALNDDEEQEVVAWCLLMEHRYLPARLVQLIGKRINETRVMARNPENIQEFYDLLHDTRKEFNITRGSLPKIIPSTPTRTPPQPFFAPVWGPECFYRAAKTPEDTLAHYENWQDTILKNGLLIHKPSGTLFGDDTGYIWVIRSLLKIFLNFVGVKYNIQFPGAIPASFDISRLPLNEWTRLLGWMDSWAQALHDSIAILQRTSEARSLGLPSAGYTDAEPDEPVATEPVMGSAPSKKRKPKPKRGPKGDKSDEGEDESEWEGGDDDNDGDEEMDFDALDRRPGEDSGEDEYRNHDPGTTLSLSGGPATLNSSKSTGTSQITISTRNLSSCATRRATPWKYRAHAFGLFFTFNDKKFTAPPPLAGALDALDDADRRWASDARELDLLADIYLSPHDTNSESLATAQGTTASLLTKYILRRRAAWAQATALSQSLFQIAARILATFRQAFKIYTAIQRHISFAEMRAEHNGTDIPEADRFNTRIEHSSMSLVVANWTYLELEAFEKMATQYLNRQEGDWLSMLPTDLTELHRIAQAQVEWADAFSKLKVERLTRRKALWAVVTTSTPFKPEHLTSGMRYAFGNPIAGEEPAGLRDALTRAAGELGRPASSLALMSGVTDTEGVTNTLGTTNEDVIMTDASSSAPGSQQDPTIPAPETVPVVPSPTPPPLASIASPDNQLNSGTSTTKEAGKELCAPPAQPPPAVASPSSATPPLSIAPPSSAAPTSSVVSAPPVTPPLPVTPDAPTEYTTGTRGARKRSAPKPNEHDTGTKRASVRQAALQAVAQAATQDNDAPARATRAGMKQAEKEKEEKEKQVAPGKRAPRKSKGRR